MPPEQEIAEIEELLGQYKYTQLQFAKDRNLPLSIRIGILAESYNGLKRRIDKQDKYIARLEQELGISHVNS